MIEEIYTIPLNEAYDKSIEDKKCGCPFCSIYEMLQKNELELILGASMMEPDIRIKTNELGFCREHFDMMLSMKNKLGLSLMLESHLDELKKAIKGGGLSFLKGKGNGTMDNIKKLEESCYICSKIDLFISKMYDIAVYLWDTERDFKKKTEQQPFFCLPHYNKLLEAGKNKLSKKSFADFYEVMSKIENGYLEELNGDVSWFCKKFDYRYTEEPWGNSKDSAERAVDFLCGKKH